MERVLSINNVMYLLQRPLPGKVAQMRMATVPRVGPEYSRQPGPPRQGAVLSLLYPQHDELYLLLTRRSEHLNSHKGQIALPGGRRESDDESLWQTALREAAEETGVEADSVRQIGTLSPLFIPTSHYDVHPFVGYADRRPALTPNPNEVTEIIEMPLRILLDPEAKRREEWLWHERSLLVPFYRYGNYAVWGATAMILSELEDLLANALEPES